MWASHRFWTILSLMETTIMDGWYVDEWLIDGRMMCGWVMSNVWTRMLMCFIVDNVDKLSDLITQNYTILCGHGLMLLKLYHVHKLCYQNLSPKEKKKTYTILTSMFWYDKLWTESKSIHMFLIQLFVIAKNCKENQ